MVNLCFIQQIFREPLLQYQAALPIAEALRHRLPPAIALTARRVCLEVHNHTVTVKGKKQQHKNQNKTAQCGRSDPETVLCYGKI